MKRIVFFIISLLMTTAFSQTVKRIDSLVIEIEKVSFTDTITIYDSTSGALRPIQVTAFLKGDTLLKTIAKYSNSTRLKFSYYDNQEKTPFYVRDIDSVTNEVLLEVYGKNNEIYQSTIVKPLEEKEIMHPYRVLQNSDFSGEIGFALVDRKAMKYRFVGSLVETVPMTPECGYFAFAIVNKFEVISTTYPNYDHKYVLIIQPCPEFLKENFFIKGRIYEIDVATNSGVTFGFSVFNNYKNENIPTFWAREIKNQK